ncbi:MAG: hypothetical protein MZV64_37530 [Ignavibacteriales bacterium]|nr:hypothetical protein [Ignavibacteriales bacterium]
MMSPTGFGFTSDPYNDDRNRFLLRCKSMWIQLPMEPCSTMAGWMNRGMVFGRIKPQLTDNGWNGETKIPFAQLRFKESEEMTWGVNFKSGY